MLVELGWRSSSVLRPGLCIVLGGLLVGLSVSVASAAPGDTVLVDRASGTNGAKANCPSFAPAITADGGEVAFSSLANNLTRRSAPARVACADQTFEIYVRDLGEQSTTLVSRASGAAGAKADEDCERPSISANGRFVAWQSFATDLTPEGNVPRRGIEVGPYLVFARDLATHRTVLVSRGTGRHSGRANADSQYADISADGRLVAFSSDATNLTRADRDRHSDVYVRNLHSSTTTLVSRASGPAGAKANGNSVITAISADGRFVLFTSSATNLSPDDTDRRDDAYVRDLVTGTTTLVSRASGAAGPKADRSASGAAISGDGRVVVFDSSADDLSADATDGTNSQVYVRDLATQTTTLVSTSNGVTANAGAGATSISTDGRVVAFESKATNLSPDDTDGGVDAYVRALATGTTTLASRASGATGAKANGELFAWHLSADGRYLTLNGSATNVSSDDHDAQDDVFRRDLQGPPA
jgi:hypothetical protein